MIDMTLTSPSPQEVWAYAVATHALDEAASRLGSAGVLLDALAEATQWRVAAGQVVHARITEFRGQVHGAMVTVRVLRGALEAQLVS
ncbi:hypothetical protein DY023_17560 [Microbacterium bovistercoris]|uniref:Uncharacterized protein n=1 Tax=Microbacterium bovistercoris TaxID=2293570 RepID=A0A371NPJ2_9MICO|nr:hypothetical protein [Microbacterium bovistercoris]REJ04111.1 hypothetical protein DY023_17560 [Microbacterium bovistercoris]